MSYKDDILRRARQYTENNALTLGDELGSGVHGIVFVTVCQRHQGEVRSAIKVHRREPDYFRERDVYQRLAQRKIKTINGCHVPRLLEYDDELLIIEMTVVSRPFVLDFGGAFLDRAPDFSEEVMAEWRAEKKEQFGKRWGDVLGILGVLESYGIFMIDVNPGNISFTD